MDLLARMPELLLRNKPSFARESRRVPLPAGRWLFHRSLFLYEEHEIILRIFRVR